MAVTFMKKLLALVYILATIGIYLWIHHPKTLTKLTQGHIKPNNQSSFGLNLQGTLDKELFVWSSIFKLVHSEFSYKNLELDLYDAYLDLPDFDTDVYFVPTSKNYCLGNFLYNVLNSDTRRNTRDYLFFDYSKKSSIKHNLGKSFRVVNKRFREIDPTMKILRKRKNYHWNPKIGVYYTKKPLHFNMKVGETYFCMFQSVNHNPGEGKLSRPDLLAQGFSEFEERWQQSQFIDFFPKSYRLHNLKECKEFFKITKSDEYKGSLIGSTQYIWKKMIDKSEDKIDVFEDRKLRSLYLNGKKCGERTDPEVVQSYINNQLVYEFGRKFKYRAFLLVSSFDPLVVYFSHGHLLLDRDGGKRQISFSKSIMSINDFVEYLESKEKEDGFQNASTKFQQTTLKLVKLAAQKIIFSQKHRLHRESRSYQVFGLDFVIDSDFKPWLVDIKNAPYFTMKHHSMIEDIFKHQFELSHYRNNKVISYLKSLKNEIDVEIMNDNLSFETEPEFLRDVQRVHNFNEVRKTIKSINRQYPNNISKPENMTLIYDERIRYGQRSTSGIEKERFQGQLDLYDLMESELDL